MNETTTIPTLNARLRAVHWREQALHLTKGSTTFVAWLIALFLVGFAVDWLIRLPGAARGFVCAALIGVPTYRAWRAGWRELRSFSLVRSALRVEKHYKHFESLLVTGVQFEAGSLGSADPTGFAAHTIAQADRAAASVQAGEVVALGGLKKPTLAAGAGLLVVLVFAIVNFGVLSTAAARLLTPWQDAQYPTRTRIALETGEIVVKEGDGVTISAQLAGVVPDKAMLAIRTGEGEPRLRQLGVTDDRCVYDMAAVYRSFDYSLRAGDATSDWHTVRVIASPAVTRSRVHITYPDYMRREPQTRESMTLTVPEGAALEWHLTLERPIRSASFRIGGAEPVPAEVSDDGLEVRYRMPAGASDSYAFTWVDREFGFAFDTAKYYLQVMPDRPPEIELVSPAGNLFATLGRRMLLRYRASDDHGIDQTAVVYRLNELPEQRFVFPNGVDADGSVHEFDWEDPKALGDLEVGDTLSLAIEVTDRYPSADGPHRARSESRRITFVSRDDYLAKLREQQLRLLAQLRSLYRQQRAAYDVVRKLDTADAAFEQTCFLESARQDIVREHLATLVAGLQGLADDLTANHIDDVAVYQQLRALQNRMRTIAGQQVGPAAERLRDLGPSTRRSPADVAEAADTINTAARELASLVIDLGVDQAMEVFASELNVIAALQHDLWVDTIDRADDDAAIAAGQVTLGMWVDRMLTELAAFDDYSRLPLAVVRLTRMVKTLRQAEVPGAMRHAADTLRAGDRAGALAAQKAIIRQLTAMEYLIRIGAERDALLDARSVVASALHAIDHPHDADSVGLDTARRALRLRVIPEIPAPMVGLLARKPSTTPDVDALLAAANESLDGVVQAQLRGVEPSPDANRAAADALRALAGVLTARLDELSRSTVYAGHAAESMERTAIVRELLGGQLRITEKTEDAEYDELDGTYLAPAQLHLGDEVRRFKRRLAQQTGGTPATERLVAPMLAMLDRAAAAMAESAPALKANKLGDAIAHQDDALDALEAAVGFANQDAAGWVNLANLVMVSEDVAVPTGFMNDIVAEQNDLIDATRTSTEQNRPRLLDIQNNLTQAVYDVGGLLSGTGASLDFEQAAIFAGSDMGLSALKLEAGQVDQAMRAQRNAVESVGDLRDQFAAAQRRFEYLATAIEFLHQRYTDAVVLRSDLSGLAMAIAGADPAATKGHADRARRLAEAAARFADRMVEATGKDGYATVTPGAQAAAAGAEAGDADRCTGELEAAVDALGVNLDEMRDLMAHLAYVPGVNPIEAPPEYDVMMEMIDLLLAQKALGVSVYRADAKDVPGYAGDLRDLYETAGELIPSTYEHESIKAAHARMGEAIKRIEAGEGDEAFASLIESEAHLRHCVLEYALNYIELPKARGSRRRKRAKSTDVSDFKLTLNMKRAFDKNWGGVEGDEARAGRSEWEVLGRRNRAALNENFVRELPLEYRDFLKDYYERLTQ